LNLILLTQTEGNVLYYIENISGFIALITSLIGLLPQVYKSYKIKSTEDISMLMLINYLICSIAWVIHGLCQNSNFVVWSNIVGTIISIISIAQKQYYDKRLRNA
jgi:MtN3 and saliva related transmembrane protein